jgi:hypothetical protein
MIHGLTTRRHFENQSATVGGKKNDNLWKMWLWLQSVSYYVSSLFPEGGITMTSQNEILERMFLASGDSYGTSSFFAGRTGAGKTYLMTEMVNQALKAPKFKSTKFIYFSVKQESYWDMPAFNNADALFQHLQKEQIGIFYPQNPEEYESELDDIIEMVFELQKENKKEGWNWTLILDDVNVLDGFSNTARPSKMNIKASVAGRSVGVKMVYILHRLGNIPRILNSSLNAGIITAISPMDNEYSKKVLSLDLEDHYDSLNRNQYSWAFADVYTGDVSLFKAI